MANRSSEDELAALRARAYGRNPDIQEDPTALKRLVELEGSLDVGEQKLDAASPREDVSGAPDAAVDDHLPVTMSAERPSIATSTKARKLWITAVVGAGVAGLIGGSFVANYDSTVIATLHESHDAEIPDDLSGPDFPNSIRFDDYQGLAVIAFSYDGEDGAPPRKCIAVQGAADTIVGGCGEGSLAAFTQITVTEDSPPALTELFADGTVLQFTRANDEILVRSSDR